MPVKVDHTLQDGGNVGQAMDNHMEIIITSGGGQKKRDNLRVSLANVAKLNKDQIKAEDFLDGKTKEQKALMLQADILITAVWNAAKSAAKEKDNDINLKKFKVGTDKPHSVTAMSALVDYLSDVVVEYHDVLVANGMREDEITSLPALFAALVASEAAQENAKKLRKAATGRRDNAARELQATITGIREYAKNVFKNSPDILEEFKPIKRGGKNKKNPPPPAPSGEPPQK
jgi:hypothetical protein